MNCWTDPTLAPSLSARVLAPALSLLVTVSPLVTQALKAQVQVPRDAQALKTQGYPGPHTALKFTSVHKNTYIYQYILYHLTYTSKSPINKWNNPKKSRISLFALASLAPSLSAQARDSAHVSLPATQAAREGSVRVPVLSPQPYAQQGLEVPCATRMVSLGTTQTLMGEAHLCAGTVASPNAQIQVHSFLVNNHVKSNFLKLLESKLKNKTFYTSHFSELEKVTLNKSPKATLELRFQRTRDKAQALYTTRKRVQPSTNTASLLSSLVLPRAEGAKATRVLGVPSESRATGSSRPNTGGPIFFPYRKSFLCYWLLPFVGFVSNLTSLESFASLELRFHLSRNSQGTQGVSLVSPLVTRAPSAQLLCWYPHTRFHISSLAPSLLAQAQASEETKVQEDAINQTLNSFRASPRSTENIILSHQKYVASKIKEEVGQEVKIYCQHYLNSLKTYLNNIDILCSSSAYATRVAFISRAESLGARVKRPTVSLTESKTSVTLTDTSAESLGASKNKPSDAFNSLSTQVIAPSVQYKGVSTVLGNSLGQASPAHLSSLAKSNPLALSTVRGGYSPLFPGSFALRNVTSKIEWSFSWYPIHSFMNHNGILEHNETFLKLNNRLDGTQPWTSALALVPAHAPSSHGLLALAQAQAQLLCWYPDVCLAPNLFSPTATQLQRHKRFHLSCAESLGASKGWVPRAFNKSNKPLKFTLFSETLYESVIARVRALPCVAVGVAAGDTFISLAPRDSAHDTSAVSLVSPLVTRAQVRDAKASPKAKQRERKVLIAYGDHSLTPSYHFPSNSPIFSFSKASSLLDNFNQKLQLGQSRPLFTFAPSAHVFEKGLGTLVSCTESLFAYGDATTAAQALSAQSLRLTKIPLGLSEGELSQGLTYNNFIEKKLLNPLMGVSAVSLLRTASESLASPLLSCAFSAPHLSASSLSSPTAKQANTSTHSKNATGTFLPKQFLTFAVNSLFNVQNNLYKSPLLDSDSHTLSALAEGVGMREGLGTPVLAPRDSARVSCTESLFAYGDAITATREKGTQRENLEIKNDSDRSKISEIKKKEKFSKNKLYFLFFKAFNSNLKEFARCAPLTAEGYLPLVPQTMVVYDNRAPLNSIASLQQRKQAEGHQSATQVKGTAQELVSLSSIGSPKANPSIPSTSQYAETFPNNTSSRNRLVLQGHSLTESASTTLFNFTHPFLTSFHFSLNKENLTYRKLAVVSSEASRLSPKANSARRSEAFNEDNLSGMHVSLGARAEGVDINTSLKTSYIMPVNNFISKRDNILNEVPYIGGLSIAPYSRSERLGGSYRKASHLQETHNLVSDSSQVRIIDNFFSGHLQNNKLKKSVSQRDTQEIVYKRDKTIKNHFLNYSTYLKIYASKVKDFLIQSHLSKKKNLGVYVRTALPFLTGNNSSIVSESGSASSLISRDSSDVLRFASHLSGTHPRAERLGARDTKSLAPSLSARKKSFIVLFPTQFKRNMVFKRSTHVSKIEKILRAYFSIKGSLDKKFINERTLEYALGTQRKPSSSLFAAGEREMKVTQAPSLSQTSAAQGFGATPKSISTYIMPSSLSFASHISRESLVSPSSLAPSLSAQAKGISQFVRSKRFSRSREGGSLVALDKSLNTIYLNKRTQKLSPNFLIKNQSFSSLPLSLALFENLSKQSTQEFIVLGSDNVESKALKKCCPCAESATLVSPKVTRAPSLSAKGNMLEKFSKEIQLRKYNKKKRRIKKLKKETRHRKKRKRFYPRPIWIRYNIYSKFLKHRYFKLKKKFQNKLFLRQSVSEALKTHFLHVSPDLKTGPSLALSAHLISRVSPSSPSATTRALSAQLLSLAPSLSSPTAMQAPASVNFWKDRTQRAQELRDINMSFYARDTKNFFRVSNTVINDFKRLLWKSYWLRSNFYPYLKKMKESLNEIKQSTQSWELYYTLKSFMNELGGFTQRWEGISQQAPLFLMRREIRRNSCAFSAPLLFLSCAESLGASKKESISSINSTKWQKALYFSQYNSITYQRLQQFLSQIRENLTYITPEPGSRFLSLDYVPFARDERSAESQGTLRTVSLFAAGYGSPKATQASSARSAEAQVKSFETPLRNFKVRTQATKSLKMSKDMVTLQNFSERSQGTSGFAGAMASRHPATFEKVKSNAPAPDFWMNLGKTIGRFSLMTPFYSFTSFGSKGNLGSKSYQVDTALASGVPSYFMDKAFLNFASDSFSQSTSSAYLGVSDYLASPSSLVLVPAHAPSSHGLLSLAQAQATGTRVAPSLSAHAQYKKKNLYLEPFIRMCWAFSKTFSSSMTEYNKRAEVWGNERNRTQTKNNKTKKFLKNFSKKWHTFLNEQYELCQLDCLQVKGRGLEINRLTRDGIRLGIPAQDQGALREDTQGLRETLVSPSVTQAFGASEGHLSVPARAVGEQRYKLIFNKTRQKEEKLQFYIGSAGLDKEKVWGNQDSPRDSARDVESTKGTVAQATRAQGLFRYSLSRASFAVGGGEKSIDVHSLHKLKKQIQIGASARVRALQRDARGTLGISLAPSSLVLVPAHVPKAQAPREREEVRSYTKSILNKQEFLKYNNLTKKSSYWWSLCEGKGSTLDFGFKHQLHKKLKNREAYLSLFDQEEGMIPLGQISAPREGLASHLSVPALASGYSSTLETDKTIISVFLFHFCSFISLISFAQIRTLLKFYYLGFSKLFDFSSFLIRFSFFGVQALQAHLISLTYSFSLFNNRRRDIENKGLRQRISRPSLVFACAESLGACFTESNTKDEGDMQSAWQKPSPGALRMARLSMTTQGPSTRYLRDKSKILLRRQSPQALHWTRMVDAIESLSSCVASLGSYPRASAPVLENSHERKRERKRERCQASQQNFYYYKKSLSDIFLRKMFKKGLGANTTDSAFLGYSCTAGAPPKAKRDTASNGYLSTLAPTALGQEQRISRLCRFHCTFGARHVRLWRKRCPSLSITQVLGHLSVPAQRRDISLRLWRKNFKESLDFPLTTRDSELKTLTLFFLLKNLHFLFYCFYYISFGITKNFISILKETTGFVFGLLPRSLYTFFEKPGELIVDWIAYSFLVEWAADLTNLIPENVDVLFSTSSFKMLRFLNSVSFLTNLATLFSFSHSYQIQSKFLLSGSVLESFSFLNIGSLFLQRRLYHLYEIFIMQFFQPDMDIIIRHKKGLIFWDIWGDFLMQVAENSNINISELTSLKEEQFKLLESGAEALFEPKSILAPIFNKSIMWETSFGNQVKETVRSLDKNGLRNFLPESFLKQISQRSIQSREKNESLKVKKQLAHKNLKASSHLSLPTATSKTTLATLGGTQVLASPGLASLSQGLRGTLGQTSSLFAFGEVGQFLSYQGKDTELFIDLYPPKSFTRLNFLKNNESLQPTVGSLVCQIHAGLLLKQVSKNVLVVSAGHQPSSLFAAGERSGRDSRNSNKSTEHGLCAERPGATLAKTLLIQAIAGETELKIITDNAYRYSLVYRGVAVGIKLLKEVFDSLALHTPCLFLMEDIHAIGSRRPLLISDDDTLKATEGSITGSQREEIHEKNQVLYQLSKHMITHYKKPYKGDFSLLIPTNHFCFDILRSNVFSSASLDSSSAYIDTKDKGSYNQLSVQDQGARFGAKRRHSFATVNGFQNKTVLPIISSQKMNNEASSLSPRGSEDRDSDKQGYGKKEVHSRLLMKSSELLAPPATSPFSVLTLKEEKKFQTLKDVIEMPWSSLPGEQLAQVLKSSYSIRVKVALLADAAMSSLSVKLDMITDLLVIIDSVKGNRGFVVFATTHIPFVLDPALRRPGRLDETIILDTTRLPSITFSPLAKQVAGTLSKDALAPSLSAREMKVQAWGTQGKTGEILAPRDTVGVPKAALLSANVRNVDNIHNFRWEILNSYFKVFKGCFCASGSPSKPSPSFESSLHSLSFLMMTSPKVELSGFACTGVHSNAARLASFAQEGEPCDVSACASESSPRVAAGDTKVVQAALKKSLSATLEKSSLFNIKRLAICKSHSRKLLSLVYFRASNLFYNNFLAYAPVAFGEGEGLLRYPCAEGATLAQALLPSVCNNTQPSEAFLSFYSVSAMSSPLAFSRAKNARVALAPRDSAREMKAQISRYPSGAPHLSSPTATSTTRDSQEDVSKLPRGPGASPKAKATPILNNVIKSYINYLISGKFGEMFFIHDETIKSNILLSYNAKNSESYFSIPLFHLLAVVKNVPFSKNSRNDGGPSYFTKDSQVGQLSSDNSERYAGLLSDVSLSSPLSRKKQLMINKVPKLSIVSSTRLVLCTQLTSLILSFIQKRYIYYQNLIVPEFLDFVNKSSFFEPLSPPTSNILLPARRYENYRRSFAYYYLSLPFMKRTVQINNNIIDKINLHQQQRLVKRLYRYPVKETFKSEFSHYISTNQNANVNRERSEATNGESEAKNLTNFSNATLMIGSLSASLNFNNNTNKVFRHRILLRHRNYLTNQWWNGQLPEHNAETTFLSDIDWRYTFMESVGDLLLDFPDAEQHYNPQNRRWLLTKGSFNFWFDFEKCIYSEFYSHLIFDCFLNLFHLYEKHRDILDYYAFYVLNKGQDNKAISFKNQQMVATGEEIERISLSLRFNSFL